MAFPFPIHIGPQKIQPTRCDPKILKTPSWPLCKRGFRSCTHFVLDPHLQPLIWGPWQFFLSRNNFFQWDGLMVCLSDRPPFFYINKPVLGHCIEFPLLIIFSWQKQKTQRPQLHPDGGGGHGQKWYQNWNRRFTTVATMSPDFTGHTGKAGFSEVQCATLCKTWGRITEILKLASGKHSWTLASIFTPGRS